MSSAESIPEDEAFPRWLVPPEGGFLAEDLDRLPKLPPHTELIDGGLVFVSPQQEIHGLVIELLLDGLRRAAPANLRARREMTVTLGRQLRVEPDILVIDADAAGLDKTTYLPESVHLVVEVVSPDSQVRDRGRKPELYAQAGIAHFWRVENVDGRPVVYVYELDPASRTYALRGIHHDRLAVALPFHLDIDLQAIDRL